MVKVHETSDQINHEKRPHMAKEQFTSDETTILIISAFVVVVVRVIDRSVYPERGTVEVVGLWTMYNSGRNE
eukprot:scaffold6380_cov84-Cylindrotheca_fusiformis.AAC.1